ncbi:hypothetical protein SAMN04488523_10110 [Sulfitobacter brevis]|uniref:Uncharacterized protein n=1 Tax=Sulfitobacter brevis TaxID=74348 RepID=A0A1I1SEY5_9RHOB|nr:hypothetical protein [Sulfitobacter brevis]SFD45011.1 hypothetical protein SAMN04488523_10110 [Sulfitobacter brevis]
MKLFNVLAVTLTLVGAQAATAGPVGIYDVVGANPGDGTAYEGAVAIKENGATYTVLWKIGEEEYIGTAIGAANLKGSTIFGEAGENDTALAVSYRSGESFGLALFVEQENGHWNGIWTYAGSDSIGSETWTPQ